jgi:predicted DNA-binding transcriptional regulator AlpA
MAADYKLGMAPKLEEIADNPALATHLPFDVVEALLGKNAIVQSVLVSRLLALRASHSQAERAPEGDRLLDVEEAARKLGKSKDYLYRHAVNYPFTVRDGRSLRFSEQGIEKFIRQRVGR